MLDFVEGSNLPEFLEKMVTPAAQATLATAASNISRAYAEELRRLGTRGVHSAVMGIASAMPSPVAWLITTVEERRQLAEKAKEAKKPIVPQWVTDTLEPIVNPILQGVKEEATRRAKVALPKIGAFFFISILTIFLSGCIVGYKFKRK